MRNVNRRFNYFDVEFLGEKKPPGGGWVIVV